jgi:serine protease AprX
MATPDTRWQSRYSFAHGVLAFLLVAATVSTPWNRPARSDAEAAHVRSTEAWAFADVRPDQPVDVVVRFRPGHERAAVASARGRVTRRLALDGSVVLRLTGDEVRRLAATGGVESLERDMPRHIARTASRAAFGVTQAAADFGLTGDGDGDPAHYSARDHTIAVIDTGVDGSYQEFGGGNIVAWQDLVNHRPQPYDDNGHGTHVASIAAGAPVAGGVGGVAPGAALVVLKVTDAQGDTTGSLIAQAVEWCIAHQKDYGIETINISLAGGDPSDGQSVDERMVNRAVAAGMVVCLAAGNDGPDLSTIGSPAGAASAITVGNIADPARDGFALDPSSSRGPTLDGRVKPDLCAPGVEIEAAEANTGSGIVAFSGTSMASPFVAGVAALMRAANPGLTPAAIKALLKETAIHFGRPGENPDYGSGRLDAYAALARAGGRPGTAPSVPRHLYVSGRLQGPGDTQSGEINVDDTRFPIAAVLLNEIEGADFDLALYDPSGHLIAGSETDLREEEVSRRPSRPGAYRWVVTAFAGTGDYSLDLSAGLALPEPATPAALSARGASVRVDLAWVDESGNETAFAVWRRTGGSDWARIAVLAPNRTTYADREVQPGVAYTYRVRAIGRGGASAWTNEAGGVPLAGPPAAPTGLVVRPLSNSQVELTWLDNSTNETAFAVWRRDRTADWARVAVRVPNTTRYRDDGLVPGRTYTYRVRATNNQGASAWTKEVEATPPAAPPSRPSALSAAVAGTAIRLTWSDNSADETAFAIWRRSGATDWVQVGVVPPNVTRFTDAGLAPGVAYTYRVRSIGLGGASGWTNEASARVVARP